MTTPVARQHFAVLHQSTFGEVSISLHADAIYTVLATKFDAEGMWAGEVLRFYEPAEKQLAWAQARSYAAQMEARA